MLVEDVQTMTGAQERCPERDVPLTLPFKGFLVTLNKLFNLFALKSLVYKQVK